MAKVNPYGKKADKSEYELHAIKQKKAGAQVSYVTASMYQEHVDQFNLVRKKLDKMHYRNVGKTAVIRTAVAYLEAQLTKGDDGIDAEIASFLANNI